MGEMPKLAVFGCGYWGKNHVRTLAELGALACVVDQDTKRAADLAQEYGVEARKASDVFADPDITGIVMALPAQFHAQIALRAFEAGKHVFAEKPIALATEDAQAMVDAARKADRILMAGHILRYHNAFHAIMKLVEDGALGDIKYVQSHRLGFGKFHMKFDALWDLAPHDLSLLLSVVGRGPDTIRPMPTSLTNGQTDFAHVHLDFGQGVKGHIQVSRHSPYMERRVTVFGSKAMAVWDDMEQDWNKKVSLHRFEVAQSSNVWEFSKDEPDYIPCQAGMALTDELAHFIDCIATGTQPLTSGQQGFDVVNILNACE